MTCTRKRLIFFSSFIHVPEAYFFAIDASCSSSHTTALRWRWQRLALFGAAIILYITVCACVFFFRISLFVILIRYEILFFHFSQYWWETAKKNCAQDNKKESFVLGITFEVLNDSFLLWHLNNDGFVDGIPCIKSILSHYSIEADFFKRIACKT